MKFYIAQYELGVVFDEFNFHVFCRLSAIEFEMETMQRKHLLLILLLTSLLLSMTSHGVEAQCSLSACRASQCGKTGDLSSKCRDCCRTADYTGLIARS